MIKQLTYRISSIVGIICLFLVGVYAQGGNAAANPFELPERLDSLKKWTEMTVVNDTVRGGNDSLSNPMLDTLAPSPPTNNPFELESNIGTAVDTEVPIADSGNPFDLAPKGNPTVVAPPVMPKANPEQASKWEKAKEKIATHTPIYLVIYSILLAIIMAVLNTLFRSDLKQTFRAFTNQNILSLSFRQKLDSYRSAGIILQFFYLFSGGLFIFLVMKHFQIEIDLPDFVVLGLVVLGLMIITFLRYSLLILVASIFPFSKEVNLYKYIISVYDYVIGVILFPLSIIIAFAPQNISEPVMWLALGLIALIYVYRSFRGLVVASKYLLFHKFHFILYLCTVEIAPIMILMKLFLIFSVK